MKDEEKHPLLRLITHCHSLAIHSLHYLFTPKLSKVVSAEIL